MKYKIALTSLVAQQRAPCFLTTSLGIPDKLHVVIKMRLSTPHGAESIALPFFSEERYPRRCLTALTKSPLVMFAPLLVSNNARVWPEPSLSSHHAHFS